ncbi:MAG: hypothetical protein HY558_02820 [Euryarchaeota archaeon]|nr:hypothetical protein [Euryarchaeota archaeon]
MVLEEVFPASVISITILVLAIAAFLSVALFASILRDTFELRKARLFLQYREFERYFTALAVAFLAATLLLVYSAFFLPGTIDPFPDFPLILLWFGSLIIGYVKLWWTYRKPDRLSRKQQ